MHFLERLRAVVSGGAGCEGGSLAKPHGELVGLLLVQPLGWSGVPGEGGRLLTFTDLSRHLKDPEQGRSE